jgi:hypothetical protein
MPTGSTGKDLINKYTTIPPEIPIKNPILFYVYWQW